MVKLRLTRLGAKKAPFYRIVAIDSRKARDGECIEQIGYYNPAADPKQIVIDAEKAQKWLANGAQPTATVAALLKDQGIIK
ncbi:MAG: 30S ribosomal protein S16 [Clostridia bacterium]|nr:30S ribosomal protein S16 [Clostridia bacterium]